MCGIATSKMRESLREAIEYDITIVCIWKMHSFIYCRYEMHSAGQIAHMKCTMAQWPT